MTLIWAEGFTGERALAPSWRRWALAAATRDDTSLPADKRGEALVEAESAREIYDDLVAQAEAALKAAAAGGTPRTHALVAGDFFNRDSRQASRRPREAGLITIQGGVVVIAAADRLGMAMVFTGMRHFLH